MGREVIGGGWGSPGVLTLEGSSIGHNVAGRGLVGELHSSHLLNACHKLTCSQGCNYEHAS